MKSIWASKVFWFNVLALVAAVAAQFGYSGELPDGWGIYVPVIVAVINMILRLFTYKPIAGSAGAKLAGYGKK